MPKKTRGSGTVYLRGNIWWLQYYSHGRAVCESSKSADRAEAERQLRVKIGEIAAGADVSPERATITDVCRLVVADHKLRGLRDVGNVEWRLNAHITPILGSILASRFSPQQVRTYVEARRAEKASNATINRELAIVRRGFTLAHREDPPLVRRIPHIAKLEEDNARQGFIEFTQYRNLLTCLPSHLKCLLVVGYWSGCRLGELRKLTWSEVDFNAREFRILKRNAKSKVARNIPFTGEMEKWLKLQFQQKNGQRVFHWEGKPIGSHLKGWSRACKKAGLPCLLFHDLRRSAVRNFENSGVPRSIAMARTGHRTESVYRRYAIVSPQDARLAADKIEAFLSDPKNQGIETATKSTTEKNSVN